MAMPKLLLKLHEKLGDEAMTEFATLFDDIGAENRAGFQELREELQEMRGEFREMRGDLRAADARLEARMESGFASLRQEIADVNTNLGRRIEEVNANLDRRIEEVNADLGRRIADVKTQVSSVQAELINWTFLFWIGTIGLVLLMLRFPG